MNNVTSHHVLPLNTKASTYLTAANCQEANVAFVSCYLSDLLIKPGIALLQQLGELATYLGFKSGVILNASLPALNANGLYVLRSPYDGTTHAYPLMDVWRIILHLQPEMVILPQGLLAHEPRLLQDLPDTVLPFVPINEIELVRSSRAYGIYVALLGNVEFVQDVPYYVAGDLSLSQICSLAKLSVDYIESDLAVRTACLGNVFVAQGTISLLDSNMASEALPIDVNCSCPTCLAPFTRAYLAHLFVHTPLLCIRLLIQHNLYYMSEVAI